jgi:hypothetical protein
MEVEQIPGHEGPEQSPERLSCFSAVPRCLGPGDVQGVLIQS